ncbi:MAG: hypothetical protein O6944_06780 [Gammaproteobacteria bacterium]|nr:hypothetical protein [Gammaproteobacteria bacterium]
MKQRPRIYNTEEQKALMRVHAEFAERTPMQLLRNRWVSPSRAAWYSSV